MTTADHRETNVSRRLRNRLETQLLSAPATPVLPVDVRHAGRPRRVWLKMEGHNQWGSIKDRTALSLLASVSYRLDSPGAVIVESTSGNLGAAIAAIAAENRLPFIAVVDPTLPAPILERLRESGARLETADHADQAGGYLSARIQRVHDICARNPGAVWPNQYENAANPDAHFRTTGPEIMAQTNGAVDAVFVAVSTGGTLTGIARYMRQTNPRTAIIAVDAVGSQVFSDHPARRVLTGIGAGRRSSFIRPYFYDDVIHVDAPTAIAFCRELRTTTGLYVGGSSGAVLAACCQYLVHHPDVTHPVCVCADDGSSYRSSIYDDAWLRANCITLTPENLTMESEPVSFNES